MMRVWTRPRAPAARQAACRGSPGGGEAAAAEVLGAAAAAAAASIQRGKESHADSPWK